MLDHHRLGRDFSLNPQRKFLLLLCLWRGLGHKILHAKFQTCSFLRLAAGAVKRDLSECSQFSDNNMCYQSSGTACNG